MCPNHNHNICNVRNQRSYNHDIIYHCIFVQSANPQLIQIFWDCGFDTSTQQVRPSCQVIVVGNSSGNHINDNKNNNKMNCGKRKKSRYCSKHLCLSYLAVIPTIVMSHGSSKYHVDQYNKEYMFSSKRIIYHFDCCQCLYISLSGWLAEELNFNKEYDKFVTAFMFLVDSQCQGFRS